MAADPHRQFRRLMSRLRAGSASAAWRLVELYEPHIRAVVRRHMSPGMRRACDSDDFVQAVWASLLRISPRLKTIDHPQKFVALLAKMARNKVVDEYRKRERTAKHNIHRERSLDDSSSPRLAVASREPSPSQAAVAREQWTRLIQGLPPLHRRVVQERLAGATYAEIAKTLDIHERSARRIVARLLEPRQTRSPRREGSRS